MGSERKHQVYSTYFIGRVESKMATLTAGKKNVRKKESAGRPSDRASGSFVEPGDTTMADIWKVSFTMQNVMN